MVKIRLVDEKSRIACRPHTFVHSMTRHPSYSTISPFIHRGISAGSVLFC